MTKIVLIRFQRGYSAELLGVAVGDREIVLIRFQRGYSAELHAQEKRTKWNTVLIRFQRGYSAELRS